MGYVGSGKGCRGNMSRGRMYVGSHFKWRGNVSRAIGELMMLRSGFDSFECNQFLKWRLGRSETQRSSH